LPTSKTDQEHHGRTVFIDITPNLPPTHPVSLLRSHLDMNTLVRGPIFWQWKRGFQRSTKPLTADGVSALVKFAAYNLLKLNGRFSGHSLRIGAATTMAEAGIEDHIIMQTCGWSSSIFKSVYLRFARSTHGDITNRMHLVIADTPHNISDSDSSEEVDECDSLWKQSLCRSRSQSQNSTSYHHASRKKRASVVIKSK